MGKQIVYTQHALAVMAERTIDLLWVERTVNDPEWSESDPFDPAVERRFRTVPEGDNRYLRVACVETAQNIRIVSAFLDRRARPT